MRRIFFIMAGLLTVANGYADPLLLTPQEMQKLKKYFPAEDPTHYAWNGEAISIALPLNQEKRLMFPSKITPDLKGALTTDQVRLINDDQSLYVTAKKPFSAVRMYVTVENSHQVILMDLSTDDKADAAPVSIDCAKNNAFATNNKTELAITQNDNDVMLIRFAWQQLYAPQHLLPLTLNITRTPMHTAYFISDLVYGDKVYAHPLASWTYQHTYVTAIELRNKYPHKTHIDISRDLCGNWQAASLYPSAYLAPAGTKPKDTTVLFLVSQKPFGDSMAVCHGGT